MAKPCPMCGNPPVEEFRPFCSQLCKSKDLLNWLNGAYVIPTPVDQTDNEDEDPKEFDA